MAVAARDSSHAVTGVIFHTDRGSTYTADQFTSPSHQVGSRQSMGRAECHLFDNAAAKAFFSTLDWEVLSRHNFATTEQAAATVLEWRYAFYNHRRRHTTGMISPITYQNTAAAIPGSRIIRASTIHGEPQSHKDSKRG